MNKRKTSWQRNQQRKKAAEAAVEANLDWLTYFESIREVCPWSGAAYKNGAIAIQHWHSQVNDLENYKARIYIAPTHNPRQLKKITDRLNNTRHNEEWLWSHPRYGYNSTPTPVLIQQDRNTLETIRKNLKNTKEYK